jgi:hypothetical protein
MPAAVPAQVVSTRAAIFGALVGVVAIGSWLARRGYSSRARAGIVSTELLGAAAMFAAPFSPGLAVGLGIAAGGNASMFLLGAPPAAASGILGRQAVACTDAPPYGQPGGCTANEVPPVRTSPGHRVDWIATRLPAARDAVAEWWPTVGPNAREAIARAFVVLWWREGIENNFNLGNLTAWGPWPGLWFRLPGNHLHFRAWNTLAEGADAFARLMATSQNYAGLTQQLARDGDGVAWYQALAAAGYSENRPAEIASEARTMRARVDSWVAQNEG